MSILEAICESMNLPLSWLLTVEKKAPFAYKSYLIPKKNGDYRQIHQPSRAVKSVQYWLIDNVFSDLPIHPASMAYRKNTNIYDNAVVHRKSNYIAKFDFNNFFPSLNERDIEIHVSRHLTNLSKREIQLIRRICCKKERRRRDLPGHLTIGSPASPILSNSMLYDFDIALSEYAGKNSLIYTRYADDITLSSKEYIPPQETIEAIQGIIDALETPSNLSINKKKTAFLSRAQSRRVTGLTITNDRKISIGREKKREVSAMIHKHTLNKLSKKNTEKLRGMLSYIRSIEPEFISRMELKYSRESIRKIVHESPPLNT